MLEANFLNTIYYLRGDRECLLWHETGYQEAFQEKQEGV